MQFINYLLALIVTFLGLYVGALLGFICAEELRVGQKYFLIIKKLLLLLIFLITIFQLFISGYYIWLVMVFSLAYYLIKKNTKDSLLFSSIFLSAAFYLSSFNADIFLLISSLIFVYALPIGTMIVYANKKSNNKDIMKLIFKHNYVYLVLPILLYYMHL